MVDPRLARGSVELGHHGLGPAVNVQDRRERAGRLRHCEPSLDLLPAGGGKADRPPRPATWDSRRGQKGPRQFARHAIECDHLRRVRRVFPQRVDRAVGREVGAGVGAVGVAQRRQPGLAHVVDVEALDSACELLEQHSAAVRRPVGGQHIAFELVERDIHPRPTSDVPDQRPVRAAPIGHAQETCIARARCEGHGAQAAVGIRDLAKNASGGRVQRHQLVAQAPGFRAGGQHRDRTVVREDRTDQQPRAAVNPARRAERAIGGDVDHGDMVGAVVGGDEAEPVAGAADAEAERRIRRHTRRDARWRAALERMRTKWPSSLPPASS